MSDSISCPRPGRPFARVLSALLVALLINPAFAAGVPQDGTITVNVKDQRGDVIAGATVTAENAETGQATQQTTNAVGVASFVGLPQGRYNVTVEAQGFKKLRWEGIEVSPDKRAKAIEATLNLGPLEQIELFNAAGDRVDAEAGESRGEGLSALPNLNYDLTPVLQNIPGAVATGPSSLGRVIVDGKGADQQTMRLDGVDFTSQVEFPSADSAVSAVGSFQKPEVAGNLDKPKARSGAFGYPAMAGPGSGLVTEIDTYKGTDLTTAQFYGDLRHDALNARNFFDYDGENGLRRARFGGKFGTTLDAKNRTGLFLAYDGWRGRVERNVYEAVPAAASSGTQAGPLGLLMRGFLPAGTETMLGSLNPDFVVARRRARTTAESNAFDARLDYRPLYPGPTATSADKDSPAARAVLTLRLTHQMAENRVPEGVTGRSQLQQFAFTNAVVGFRIVNGLKAVRNENLLKQSQKELGHFFRFGINRTHARVKAEAPSIGGFDLSRSLVNISGPVNVQRLPIAPLPDGQQATIPVASLGGLLAGFGRGLDLKPTSYSAVYDYATLITGDSLHELYAGGEARFIRLGYDRLGGLTYSFPSVAALSSGTPSSVTFLSDLSAQGPFRPGTGHRQARQEFYMGYFQMVSQFRRKAHQQSHDQNPNGDQLEPALTLTYGVRYDHFGGVRERDDRAVVVNPLTGEILPAGTPFYRVEHDNIQPRFGLAYRLSDEAPFKDTVLRAGVGLYSGVPRIGDLLLPIDSDRYSVRINTGVTLPSNSADLMRVFDLNTQARFYQPLAFARDYSPLERSLKWDVRIGHTHNGYEYSAYYIGNVGRNLGLANFANRIVGVKTNPDPTKPAEVTREFGDAFDEFLYRRGGGRSSFNALTLQLSRDADDTSDTPKRWLKIPVSNFTAKYTLSRSVGNVSGTLMSNPLDPDADFGDNAGVARHSFSLNATYDLWQLSKDRKLNHGLLGWKIMPVLKVTSGLPLIVRLQRPDVVYMDGAGNIFGSAATGRTAVLNTPGGGGAAGAYVPNLVPGVNPYAGGFAGRLYLDPAAFSIPAPGTLGNVRRGQFKGPAVVQLDLGLRRHFFNSEKKQLEFQVEIFNVFNRTNFLNPTASLPNALGTSAADNQIQPGIPFSRAGASTFGFITAADQGRLIQFSLTLKLNKGFTK